MDNTSVFLTIPKTDYLIETTSFFAIKDRFPVSPGHSLIITKKLRKDYFELTTEEQAELPTIINLVVEQMQKEFAPDGFNIGMNCGAAAGQTVFHFHYHIIPRYNGDMQDPRGGIRHCVTGKGYY